jgi:hypothetical protein
VLFDRPRAERVRGKLDERDRQILVRDRTHVPRVKYVRFCGAARRQNLDLHQRIAAPDAVGICRAAGISRDALESKPDPGLAEGGGLPWREDHLAGDWRWRCRTFRTGRHRQETKNSNQGTHDGNYRKAPAMQHLSCSTYSCSTYHEAPAVQHLPCSTYRAAPIRAAPVPVFGLPVSVVVWIVSLSSQSRAGTVPNSPFPAGSLYFPQALPCQRFDKAPPGASFFVSIFQMTFTP